MKNINDNHMVTAECPNCGVELTCSAIDPATKCHWCHTLIPASLYVETPNMPEQILPFKFDKKEAKKIIDEFINDRQTYATEEFLADYNSDNIVPVYLPYILVDINLHSENRGVFSNYQLKDSATYKEYITRDFDMYIENALIEASKSNYFNSVNSTSNVISSVVPFDIENAVEFNTNYLNGYLSENRELNIDLLKPQVNKLVERKINNFLDDETTNYYNELGQRNKKTHWYKKRYNILGTQWSSIFLPVWIYSYCEKEDGVNKIYYIVVNGRTGKIVGSLPYNKKKVSNLKIKINLIYYACMAIFLSILFKFYVGKLENISAVLFTDEFSTLICVLIMIIPIMHICKKAYENSTINKIKNTYIYNKNNTINSETNVVVYNWDYKNHHNKKGELR